MFLEHLDLAAPNLDTTFRDPRVIPNLFHLRRKGLRDMLRRALSLAREKIVDAMTVSYGLHEAETGSIDPVQFLRQQFGQITLIHVLIAPGNHGLYAANPIYSSMAWSCNDHVFREPRLTRAPQSDAVKVQKRLPKVHSELYEKVCVCISHKERSNDHKTYQTG